MCHHASAAFAVCAIATHPRRRAAFSLVEILVVCVLIVLLVGITVPMFFGTREAAAHVACLSQQRQLGICTASYAQDNKG